MRNNLSKWSWQDTAAADFEEAHQPCNSDVLCTCQQVLTVCPLFTWKTAVENGVGTLCITYLRVCMYSVCTVSRLTFCSCCILVLLVTTVSIVILYVYMQISFYDQFKYLLMKTRFFSDNIITHFTASFLAVNIISVHLCLSVFVEFYVCLIFAVNI